MVQTEQFVHDYLGNPDMDMASIAKGFGVDGEIVQNPAQLREALARARKHTVDGKPYLLDVQVARKGVGWAREAVGAADPGRGDAHQEGCEIRDRHRVVSHGRERSRRMRRSPCWLRLIACSLVPHGASPSGAHA